MHKGGFGWFSWCAGEEGNGSRKLAVLVMLR